MIMATDWRPRVQNTLQGFLTLKLSPSGIVLRECSLHEAKDDRRWIGLPSKPQIGEDGRHRTDPTTSKKLYTPIVEVAGKNERERFQAAALAAVDRLLAATGGAP
jgi:hypothetical protein